MMRVHLERDLFEACSLCYRDQKIQTLQSERADWRPRDDPEMQLKFECSLLQNSPFPGAGGDQSFFS